MEEYDGMINEIFIRRGEELGFGKRYPRENETEYDGRKKIIRQIIGNMWKKQLEPGLTCGYGGTYRDPSQLDAYVMSIPNRKSPSLLAEGGILDLDILTQDSALTRVATALIYAEIDSQLAPFNPTNQYRLKN